MLFGILADSEDHVAMPVNVGLSVNAARGHGWQRAVGDGKMAVVCIIQCYTHCLIVQHDLMMESRAGRTGAGPPLRLVV